MPPDVATVTASGGHGRQAEEHARPSASFGALLLRARKERGISHDDVARDTRVPRRYLLALENESISGLPGGVYNRAYLRTYAAYVGLDADSVLRNYDQTVQERTSAGPRQDEIAALHAVLQQKELRRVDRNVRGILKGRVALSSMALLVLGGGVWVGARHLTYPARIPPARSSTAPAVVSDTVPNSAKMNAEPELRGPDVEAESRPSTATPVLTTPEETAEVTNSEDRHVSTSMSVHDSGVGSDVVDRELVGRSDTFPVDTRVVFWTLVTGGRPGETIRHVWFHEGRAVATVNLRVGSASWRTHSQRMLVSGADGEWVVEAQDADGRVLARNAFHCEL